MNSLTGDREVLETCIRWMDEGHTIELVTVVDTWGSSPRPPGSLAAVREDGVLVGSVSGGCIEKQLAESFRGNKGSRTLRQAITDNDARRFGLACGGNIELVFETLETNSDLRQIVAALDSRKRMNRTISLRDHSVSVVPAHADDRFHYDGQSVSKIFGPAWRVLIIGAGQLSRFTAQFATALDFDVVVCEPRSEFRQAWELPDTLLVSESPDDAVLQHAQDENTAVLALTHDPNLDDLALIEALPTKAFYVGALGSTRNYEKRKKRLLAVGLSAEEIERLHGPIGLSIGSRTSPEIAVSILAELVLYRSRIESVREKSTTG